MWPRSQSARSGFTFLELLACLCLILLLMAMLFPSFARARQGAKSASCRSNLGQIGMALNLYAQDNNGRFPADERSYQMVIQPYIKNYGILFCPDEPTALRTRYASGRVLKLASQDGFSTSYQYRSGLFNDAPAATLIGADWGAWHHGGANVLSVAGSTRWLPEGDVGLLAQEARVVPDPATIQPLPQVTEEE